MAGRGQAIENVIATKTFPRADVHALSATTTDGSIEVRGAVAGDAKVDAVKPAGSRGHCALVVELKDGRLSLEARPPDGWSGGCDAGFRVTLPRAAAVEAFAGSGTVSVTGMRGETKIRTGSGAVRLDRIEAPVHVMTGSGAVSGDVARTPWLDARTGAGAVTLRLGRGRATVSVRTGAGDIALTAPQGVAARVKVQSASGSVTNALPEAPGAPLSIEALTGSGRVRLSPAP